MQTQSYMIVDYKNETEGQKDSGLPDLRWLRKHIEHKIREQKTSGFFFLKCWILLNKYYITKSVTTKFFENNGQ